MGTAKKKWYLIRRGNGRAAATQKSIISPFGVQLEVGRLGLEMQSHESLPNGEREAAAMRQPRCTFSDDSNGNGETENTNNI